MNPGEHLANIKVDRVRSETQGLLSAVARLMTAHAGQIDAMFTEGIQPHPEFAVRVSGLPPHVSAHHLVERLAVYGEVHSVVIRPNATEASTWALVEFDSSHAAAEAVQPCNQLWYVEGGDGQPMTLSPVGAAVVYKVLAPCKLQSALTQATTITSEQKNTHTHTLTHTKKKQSKGDR